MRILIGVLFFFFSFLEGASWSEPMGLDLRVLLTCNNNVDTTRLATSHISSAASKNSTQGVKGESKAVID